MAVVMAATMAATMAAASIVVCVCQISVYVLGPLGASGMCVCRCFIYGDSRQHSRTHEAFGGALVAYLSFIYISRSDAVFIYLSGRLFPSLSTEYSSLFFALTSARLRAERDMWSVRRV